MFGVGKKCSFTMHSEDVISTLQEKPFFLMFVDSPSADNVSILSSSTVNLSVYGKDYNFFNDQEENVNHRRNYICLFDTAKNEAVKLDVTIGIYLSNKSSEEVRDIQQQKIMVQNMAKEREEAEKRSRTIRTDPSYKENRPVEEEIIDTRPVAY
jgi:hypothetical protein